MKYGGTDKMSTSYFLDRMAQASHKRVKEARARNSEGQLVQQALAAPTPPPLVLDDFNIIAELKMRSPAGGALTGKQFDRDTQIAAYASGGANAVSVLTEPNEFSGSLRDLSEVTASLMDHRIPVMRKDFLTDPYQVLEARIAGASGVLVIITMLSDSQITALLDSAMEYGMFVLLEGFNEQDLERICSLKISDHSPAPILCGVNCRDLKNLEINFDRFQKLATHLPPDLPAVAESGIKEPADVITVAKLGYRAALIGSALMRSTDAARELVSLKNAGVETVREVSCS